MGKRDGFLGGVLIHLDTFDFTRANCKYNQIVIYYFYAILGVVSRGDP